VRTAVAVHGCSDDGEVMLWLGIAQVGRQLTNVK
jgi:hypothetical protein